MDNLYIETQKNLSESTVLPDKELELKFYAALNMLIVKGDSNHISEIQAYYQLIEKVKNHLDSSEKLSCYFHYSAINGTTVKLLFNLFNVIQEAQNLNKKVVVYWMVDRQNVEVLAAGLEFESSHQFRFEIAYA